MKSARTIVEIWLWGGPSQIETFDPKPNAGRDYNGDLKAIPTCVKGMEIHEWWPRLAGCANLFSVVRSLTHRHNGHESAAYLMQTGREPGGDTCPAIGAVVAQAKRNSYDGDLPPYVILTRAKGRFSEVGFLGDAVAPLVTGGNPAAPRFAVDGFVPPEEVTPQKAKERFQLLQELDAWRPEHDAGNLARSVQFDNAGKEARHISEGKAAQVFNLNLESTETRERYGRNRVGQTLLAARRLVEYGVPSITINLTGWDSHKRHFETMRRTSGETDQAVAAFLQDLHERKLLDSTLVWMSGEFGRTPKVGWEAPWNGGRGHWCHAFSAMVAGGGFRGGCVVGATDDRGERPVERPVTPQDFLGSLYELCGLDPDGPLPNDAGRKMPLLPPASPAGRLREIYA